MGDWGYGLFQSELDIYSIEDFDAALGLTELAKEARAKLKAEKDAAGAESNAEMPTYSIFVGGRGFIGRRRKSDIGAVRSYVDSSGALKDLFDDLAIKCATVAPSDKRSIPSFKFVLLGACAMSTGCKLPEDARHTLEKVYSMVGLKPIALRQIRKALFGPDAFKDGKPYDFGCTLPHDPVVEDILKNSKMKMWTSDPNSNVMHMGSTLVGGPTASLSQRGGDARSCKAVSDMMTVTGQGHSEDVFGCCGAAKSKKDGSLLACGKYKRKYCSKDCQKRHWRMHKKSCVAPATVGEMD